MAEQVVLGSFATLQNSSIVATLNANNTLIQNAFLDCLSLSGNQPNQMQSNLDMNSFNIINLPSPATLNSPVRLVDLTATTSSISPSLIALLAVANNFTNINTFSNTTQSTTTGTGAVVIAGGLGIAKNLFVGGSLNITGSFNIATIFGGTAAGSTLTLASTSNVAPSGDSISMQGSKIFFKSATGGSTFGDYNNTTAATWTFTGNVNVIGNFGVTGSSSTFSFSGADLGLGTASPAHNAGFATLTLNGSTGGVVQWQNNGTNTAQIFNSSATLLTFKMFSASGIFQFIQNATQVLDYNNTVANTWAFSGSAGVVINTAVGQMLAVVSTNTGAANSIALSNNGTASNAATAAFLSISLPSNTFNLRVLGGASPQMQFFSSSGMTGGVLIQNAGPTIINPTTNLQFQIGGGAIGDFGFATANTWSFHGSAGVVIDTAVNAMLNVVSVNTGNTNSIIIQNNGTGTNAATGAQLSVNIGNVAGGTFVLKAVGGAGASGLNGQLVSGSGFTNGMILQTIAGLITLNAATNLVFQSNSVTVADYNSSNASFWTFPNAILSTVSGTQASSGFQVRSANPGLSLANTSAAADTKWWDIVANTTGIFYRTVNDANSVANNYFEIDRSTTTVSNIKYGGNTHQFGTSGMVTGVGDYNLTNVNQWTFRASSGVTIDTSTGQMLTVSSANTGGTNFMQITNTGTNTNAATTAGIQATVPGAGSFAILAEGGSGASGLICGITSTSGLTNGISFISGAGPIVVNAKTSIQLQSNSIGVGDYGFTTASVWTFSAKVTGTGLFGTSSAGSAAAPSLYVGNVTTGFHSVSTTGFSIDVNGVAQADYGITVAGQWTFGGTTSTNTIVPLSVRAATAPVAGGALFITLGTAAGPTICAGSGAPTLSAVQGSLYLRTDGSSTSTRAYINTNGSTTWTAITTVA